MGPPPMVLTKVATASPAEPKQLAAAATRDETSIRRWARVQCVDTGQSLITGTGRKMAQTPEMILVKRPLKK